MSSKIGEIIDLETNHVKYDLWKEADTITCECRSTHKEKQYPDMRSFLATAEKDFSQMVFLYNVCTVGK